MQQRVCERWGKDMTWLVDWNVLPYHPVLFRGALLQQPVRRRWPFSYSTEHRHNQPPGAAKLSSAEAVLTSSATATVTRKQSLRTCVCVCVCARARARAYIYMGLCDCVHAFILSHGITGFVRVPEKQREFIRAWIWWIRIILPHGYKPLWYIVYSITFVIPIACVHKSSWVLSFRRQSSRRRRWNQYRYHFYFFCQLIFVQKSARSYLARLICQSRCLDKLPVRGELTWVPLTYIPLICVCRLMNDRQCMFHCGA